MPRQVTFGKELPYERQVYDAHVVWVPSVNAEFEGPKGIKIGRAILDSGSPWCAIPESIAVGHLGVDLSKCKRIRITPLSGPVVSVPFTDMMVRIRSMGVETMCMTLLTQGGPYIIGRNPIFGAVTIGFLEEVDGNYNRILVASK